MIHSISRQRCIKQFPSLPLRNYDVENDREVIQYPGIHNTYVFTLASKSFRGHAKQMGIELFLLSKKLETGSFIFLGDTNIPWLYQQNNYPPAKKAYEYFSAQHLDRRFCGGLQVECYDLPLFIKYLSWLTRCNASLPCIYFTDPGQQIIGNICKYGNLHLDSLNPQADDLVLQNIASGGLILQPQNCFNQFGNTSTLQGRILKI